MRFFLAVLIIFCVVSASWGQEKTNNGSQDLIKGRINALIEKNRQEESETVRPKPDTIKIAKPDTTIKKTSTDQQLLDSLMEVNQAGLIDEGSSVSKGVVDTTYFKNRVLSVKKRRPKKEFKSENSWSKYYKLTHGNSYKKEHKIDSTTKVFGWHPYWMGTAYKSYNFSLLSAIAYFSYELNPNTGGYKTIHDWKTTALIDSAQQHGTKVLLSVTNFGQANNAKFLTNLDAQRTFINTLITLLRERNADGVNLDFENIPSYTRKQFTNFIIDLSSSLRAAKKDYLITLAVPPIDFDRVYELRQLNQHVDMYIIMGYEFYGANSTVAGPVAPLNSGQTWWEYNLQSAVDEYLVGGVPNNKLLLGLPYYGAEWETRDLKFPSKVNRFIRYPMYRNIQKEHGDLPCCEDEVSKSKFYVYRDNQNNYRQLWYEDSLTLARKYDWIKEKKLGGVGIWALGYDNGFKELWKLLAAKFAMTPDEIKQANAVARSKRFSPRRWMSLAFRIIKNPNYLLKNPRPLFGIFGAVFGVSMLGFFVLYRYGCRFKRMFNIVIKGGLALLIIVLVALLFIGMQYTGVREIVFLLAGFVIGAIIFLWISRQFLSEKDLP
ncbi:glycosyl hydrolase family 18 protein [Fulvivirga aurantia]|uniref:glycosyl hydrolase family 18 protein n=1 Tax=Fulvivirga aurantia TaxID=2529383 RepID=UPI001626008A|nr:glycosyl hydrolase family 18 protein [Fulvivirga aurantia]